MQPMWAGIAGAIVNGGTAIEIALSIHDSVYSTDFAADSIPYYRNDLEQSAIAIEKHVLQTLKKFSQEHLCKFLGAGVALALLKEVRVNSIPFSCILTDVRVHLSPRICVQGYGWTWTLSRLCST